MSTDLKNQHLLALLLGQLLLLHFFAIGFMSGDDGILKIAFVPATIVATIAMFVGMWFEKKVV